MDEPFSSPAPESFSASASPGVDLALLDDLATGLADVQSALERIDAGTYGRCEQCGAQIDDAMLESNPVARHCAAHLPFETVGPNGPQT